MKETTPGWKLIMEKLGDRVFIIGDDLVTTKDSNIEACAKNGEINAALIKANQIGTLSETILAMLTAMAYGAELVVSHRSKSPNDPFEADIATAMDAVGMKCGGGANTERLQKYGRVMEILAVAQSGKRKVSDKEREEAKVMLKELVATLTGRKDIELAPNATDLDMVRLVLRVLAVEMVTGTEEATNTGIPSAAATIFLGKSGTIRFKGSTPLGASTGEDEAIHFVDSMIVPSEITKKYPELFKKLDDGTLRFAKNVKTADIEAKRDPALLARWKEAQRYDGKGCLEAVAHIDNILGPVFVGRNLAKLGKLEDIDRELLALEKAEATKLGWLAANAPAEKQVHVMQRKAAVGMNAILSMSVAFGRVTAAKDGKELWQLIRETATDTMAKFIVANAKDAGGKDVAAIKAMPFEQVKALYCQQAGQAVKEGKTIYELLRLQLPIYTINRA